MYMNYNGCVNTVYLHCLDNIIQLLSIVEVDMSFYAPFSKEKSILKKDVVLDQY